MKKITEMMLPRTIVRLVFYGFICKYIYAESGIATTLLFAFLILENAIRADHFDAMHSLVCDIVEHTNRIVKFQNEYIITRIKRKVREGMCPICYAIVITETECVNCGTMQHTNCMGVTDNGLICNACSEIEEKR